MYAANIQCLFDYTTVSFKPKSNSDGRDSDAQITHHPGKRFEQYFKSQSNLYIRFVLFNLFSKHTLCLK